MIIQDIEVLLNAFNQQAGNIKKQLTTLLAMVSDGRVPPEKAISSFNVDVESLRTKYDDIYEATRSIIGEEKMPAKGNNINTYVEVAKTSKSRLLNEQIKQIKDILSRFITIRSKIETYNDALKPYQNDAAILLSQISESTVNDILPKTDAPKAFLQAMQFKKITESDAGMKIMYDIRKYYSFDIQMGLASNLYNFARNIDTDLSSNESVLEQDKSHQVLSDQVSPVSKIGGIGVENIKSDDNSSFIKAHEIKSPTSEDKNSISSGVDFNDRNNREEKSFIDGKEAHDSPDGLKIVNKPQNRTPSATSFRKEVIKLDKINGKISIILPLLTNLGILTKEQCFLFAVCMDCLDESEKDRESIDSAMENLAAKGYLTCFEYEDGGKQISAYCLSNYCNSCMEKESIAVKMKGFWALSFGNYKFVPSTEITETVVADAVNINHSLLKYIYMTKGILSKEEFEDVKCSISWQDGYYQVVVYNDSNKYVCHLLNSADHINEIHGNVLLVCDKQYSLDSIHADDEKNIFILEHGIISILKEKTIASKNDLSIVSDEKKFVINHGNAENYSSDVNHIIDSPNEEQNTYASAVDANLEIVSKGTDTLGGLLQKKTVPEDKEFYNTILNILNKEVTTQEQLKSTIVNAALLAKGAGLESGCNKSRQLSMQLRLATKVLIEGNAYTSESLTMAFPDINDKNRVMALSAYLIAMLTPATPFDYGLFNQTKSLFDNYETYFVNLDAFKPLFNKLMSVHKASPTGFTPSVISLLGSDDKSENFLYELRKQSQQYLKIKAPKTRMKVLPIFYNDCFGAKSDLYECIKIMSENKKDSDALEFIKSVLDEFCDVNSNTYVLNDQKIEDYLNTKWSNKNKFKLAYDAYNQTIRQFRIRLEVMISWVTHINELNSNKQDIFRIRQLRIELLDIIHDINKDCVWKNQRNANVLTWILRYMQKYLDGEIEEIEIYSDLLYTGIIGIDDNGSPVIDETMVKIKFYEPWRNALRHILAPKKSADSVKDEILGNMPENTDEEAGLKDNLHQLLMLGKFLKSEDSEYVISENQRREATASADDRTTHFNEILELAYTYNQINEIEKETLSGIMTQYKKLFYKSMDFARWRRFLRALELQIQEFADGRKKELRARLDVKLEINPDSSLLKEADRLLEKDKNFAVTEEYITRFDNGETEVENEFGVISQDKDYFSEFLSHDKFDRLLQKCRQGKGRALKNFGWDTVEKFLPKEWTRRLKDDSMNMISNWPSRKDNTTTDQIQKLFKCLGFNVINANKKSGCKEEMFQISVKPTPKSMADYRHPIASFGTQIKSTVNVIVLYGNHTERQLVDTISSLDLGGISVVLIDQPIDAAGRRLIGEIFHTQTSGQNPFLLIDQVLFLYLAMNQETERLPALLECTLPYTTYQPFVRDGGSTADEMFCGRSQELATIIDPNGACVVYGGRQLGKTALLERAENRCSKPDRKEYAVYSTIIRIDNEAEVVSTLIADIDKKTNGEISLSKCKTLKEMCDQLSRMFRNGQIATMHLLIDEVDCFLVAIADDAYRQIQPLVDLKRETKNNFKFVLTGLHNVCRAKNATRENGIFGQLGTPLCIRPLSPTDALQLLSRPLSYLGFKIDIYPHLATILTNTNYYPGILQFFGYRLVETLIGQYTKYYRAANGNPPFKLQDEQLGAVMNSADLNKSIKDKFCLSLELDERYFMIARCITMLYHFYEEDRTMGSWMGFKVKDIREVANSYEIHCLENESVDSFSNLLDEMVEMGILSQPIKGFYRLRRSSFVDIIGEDMDTLERDIANNNEVIA